MNRFRRAFRTPLSRKILFLRVSLLLLALRAALRLFPFARVYRFVRRFHPAQPPAARRQADRRPAQEEAACWAINRAGHFWFRDDGCLPQALLGEAMLLRRGAPARLAIGVRRGGENAILAHAWVESDGRVVIGGGAGLAHFETLPDVLTAFEES